MSKHEVTRTEHGDTIAYTIFIDGFDASELVIHTGTREVANIETRRSYQRQGLARLLWAYANDEAECFHSLDHHRTAEGALFAQAVGGETISEELGTVDACAICETAHDDEDTDDDPQW